MSPLRFLRPGPPTPNVALLPDAMFFTRSVPVTPGATPVEAATQLELALEAISPFPLAQLYYGWFWQPGAERALVFAAYRRRFTTDQTAQWQGAELVLPTFATVLGMPVQPATTVLLSSEAGWTAVHWESGPIPSKVLVRSVDADASEEERARARESLLREVGGSKTVVDVNEPPVADATQGDRDVTFRAAGLVSTLPAPLASALDVRDKGELEAMRAGRKRDVMLWRLTLAGAAALLLLGLGELGLVAGRGWQQVRLAKVRGQQPLVEKIENLANQANRIEELSTKRLLPLEMMTALVGENLERKPEDIRFEFVRATQSEGLYTITVRGQTNNTAQISVYQKTLQSLPEAEKVELHVEGTRGETTTFTLRATFKPDAIKPAVPAA